MRLKIISTILLGSFLLFLGCKSSLVDLCPNLFSNSTVKSAVSSSVPSCHKAEETNHSSGNQNKKKTDFDCDCPLVFLDYTSVGDYPSLLNNKNISFTYLSFDSIIARAHMAPLAWNHSLASGNRRSFPSATEHFTGSIRLLI